MKEFVINVKGMVCNGCENRIVNALKNIEGIQNVIADHNTGRVIVTSNDNIGEGIVEDKIKDLGFEVVTED